MQTTYLLTYLLGVRACRRRVRSAHRGGVAERVLHCRVGLGDLLPDRVHVHGAAVGVVPPRVEHSQLPLIQARL